MADVFHRETIYTSCKNRGIGDLLLRILCTVQGQGRCNSVLKGSDGGMSHLEPYFGNFICPAFQRHKEKGQ